MLSKRYAKKGKVTNREKKKRIPGVRRDSLGKRHQRRDNIHRRNKLRRPEFSRAITRSKK